MSRSSIERSQCSPNGVHPIPTIATRSRIPLLAIVLASCGPCLPEVVVDAAGGVHPAERHLDAGADVDVAGAAVGQLAAEAPAAVEVDRRGDRRRGKRG